MHQSTFFIVVVLDVNNVMQWFRCNLHTLLGWFTRSTLLHFSTDEIETERRHDSHLGLIDELRNGLNLEYTWIVIFGGGEGM